MPNGEPVASLITIDSIERALKSLDYRQQASSSLFQPQPLEDLFIIDVVLQTAHAPASELSRSWALRYWLTDIITARYVSLRDSHQLATQPPHLDACSDYIRQDYATPSDELHGYCLLYYRYAHPTYAFTMNDFVSAVPTNSRNLRRIQRRSLLRLHDHIIEAERQARIGYHQAHLCTKIQARLSHLVGRESEQRTIWDEFQQTKPRPIILTGAKGIGKSVLAASTADQLIQSNQLDYLVWINHPQTTHQVQQSVNVELNAHSLKYNWRHFLQRFKLLLVLDNCDHLLSEAVFQQFLVDMQYAAIILITERRIHTIQDALTIHLDELSNALVANLVASYHVTRQQRSQLLQIGGNPSVIKLAAHAVALSPTMMAVHSFASLADHYFGRLNEEQILIWALCTLTEQGISRNSLADFGLAPQLARLLIDYDIIYERDKQLYVQPTLARCLIAHYQASSQFSAYLNDQLQHLLISSQNKQGSQWLMINILDSQWLTLDSYQYQTYLQNCDIASLPPNWLTQWAARAEAWMRLASHTIQRAPQVYEQYAIALRRLKRLPLARSYLQTLVEQYGKHGHFDRQMCCYYQLGLCLQAMGLLADADAIFEYIIQLNKRWVAECYLQRARIAIEINDSDSALYFLSQVDDGMPEAYILRHEALYLNGTIAPHLEMIKHYPQTNALTNKQKGALYTLIARTCTQLGQNEDAILYYEMALNSTQKELDWFDIGRARSNLISAKLSYGIVPPDERQYYQQQLRETMQLQRDIHDFIGLEATRHNQRHFQNDDQS